MTWWEALFGRTVTPAERLRQHLRSLQRAQRELERERTKLEAQEKKLTADIGGTRGRDRWLPVKSWRAISFGHDEAYTNFIR